MALRTTPGRRGRPSDPAKRDAILKAARALFFRGGPDAVTMEAVASEAGVSKVTVYAHFSHRDELMRAVVVAQQERLVAALHNPVDDIAGLERALTSFGLDLLNFFCSDDHLLLDRMLAVQIYADPGLGQLIYEHGPLAMLKQLEKLLESLHVRGLLRCDNTQVAAEQLVGMWVGILHERMIMGGKKPGKAELERRVDNGVETFVRAFGVAEKLTGN
jgi:TetR/AcrR family transcriptional repressor of mexJK operon